MTTKESNSDSKKTLTDTVGTKKVTTASLYADLVELHNQVRGNREMLDEKIESVNHSVMEYIEIVKEQSHAEKEQLAKAFKDLKEHVNKISDVVDGSMEDIKTNMERIQEGLSSSVIPPTSNVVSPCPSEDVKTWWENVKASSWWPWVKNIAIILILWLLLVNVVMPRLGQMVRWFIPGINIPTVNVNTPAGYAATEVSREPFRSDAASRATFGRIFANLDRLVLDGQLTDFEGYYNEFGREMQRGIPADRYGTWAKFWDNVATLAHRSGNGGTDVREFNAALQSAARVVAAPQAYFNYPVTPATGGFGDYSSPAGNEPAGRTMRFGELPNTGQASGTGSTQVPDSLP